MPDQLLTSSSSACWLLLYLFFLRVLRAVWAEVNAARSAVEAPAPRRGGRRAPGRATRQGRGHGASWRAGRSPPAQQGRTYPLGRGDHRRPGRRVPGHHRRHLRVAAPRPRVPADGQVYVEDLGSTNGTYLNRKKVTGPMVMQRGDRLQVGNTVLELGVTGVVLRRAAATDVGRVRSINQDSSCCSPARPVRGGRRHGRPPGRRGGLGGCAVETLERPRHRRHRRRRSIEAVRRRQPARSSTQGERRPRPARHGHHPVRRRAGACDGDRRGRGPIALWSTSATPAATSARRRRSPSSPTTTAWSRTSCATGQLTPRRPRSTRSATSSPGPSASTRTSRSTAGTRRPRARRPLPALQRRPVQRGRRATRWRGAAPPRRPRRGGRRAGAPGQRGRRPGQHHRGRRRRGRRRWRPPTAASAALADGAPVGPSTGQPSAPARRAGDGRASRRSPPGTDSPCEGPPGARTGLPSTGPARAATPSGRPRHRAEDSPTSASRR